MFLSHSVVCHLFLSKSHNMIQKLVSVAKWLIHMPCKLRIVGSIQDLSIFSEDFKPRFCLHISIAVERDVEDEMVQQTLHG